MGAAAAAARVSPEPSPLLRSDADVVLYRGGVDNMALIYTPEMGSWKKAVDTNRACMCITCDVFGFGR